MLYAHATWYITVCFAVLDKIWYISMRNVMLTVIHDLRKMERLSSPQALHNVVCIQIPEKKRTLYVSRRA